jgi:hypothetical protein
MVLTTAVMVDDVMGLVVVRVISSLSGIVDAETIARSISVSIAFLVIMFLFLTREEITDTTVVRPIEGVDGEGQLPIN